MIDIDIISGFQGAGKSTFILRLLDTVYQNIPLALLENEAGKVRLSDGVRKTAMKNQTAAAAQSGAGISVTEIPAGCICCSRSDMLAETINTLIRQGTCKRILLEPSGTARLTDLLPLVQGILPDSARISHVVSVVDAGSFQNRMLVSKVFFERQLRNSPLVYLSKTDCLSPEETAAVRRQILETAPDCRILAPDLKEWNDAALPPSATFVRHSIPFHRPACTFSGRFPSDV